MFAPYENEANNHEESNYKNNDPNNFHFVHIVFIVSKAKLNNEDEVHIMVLRDYSNVFSIQYTGIRIFYDDFQFFVQLQLCQIVSIDIIKQNAMLVSDVKSIGEVMSAWDAISTQ